MNIKNLIKEHEFIEFHNLMTNLCNHRSNSYSYIGYNFSSNEITSVKFYYVVFDNLNLNDPFPIPNLENDYKEMVLLKSNYHFSTPFTPGGGCTFTIKVDQERKYTKGFFFRINDNNSALINNIQTQYPEQSFEESDFEDGYGQYVLDKDGISVKNEYLYLKNNIKVANFQEKYGIKFSKTPSIEISSAGVDNHFSQKFIALGGRGLIEESFYNRIPSSVIESLKDLCVEFCCPSINPNKGEYTIYAFSKGLQQNDGYSPIKEIIKKYR